MAKQSNDTSVALSALLLDANSFRHGTLQNRAAIDVLLLAYSHGCQDFEGMCCVNLSDHKWINLQVHFKAERVNQLQVDERWGWLDGLFKGWGITGCLKTLLKTGLLILLVVVIIALCFPCLLGFLQKALQKSLAAVFVAQIQKKGEF